MEHFWPGSPLIFLLAWFGWRIANKAGYSGFWGLTALVPPVGLIALWCLAGVRRWPRDDEAEAAPRSGGERPADGNPPAGRRSKGITIRRPDGPPTRG